MSVDPRFDDASLWEVFPGRNVFDEHEATDPATGVKVKIDRKRLEKIAAQMNERSQAQPCPLTKGHTVPHQYDDDGKLIRPSREEEQPVTLGYARNFTVAYDDSLARHVLRADFHLDRTKADDAKTYPRPSVEFWPRMNEITPIALLRRTPKRDLGQWIYDRRGPCLRYSMEAAAMDEPAEKKPENGPTDPTTPPDAAAPDMQMRETILQCLRELLPGMVQQAMQPPPTAALQEAAMPAEPEVPGAAEVEDGKEEVAAGEEEEVEGEEEEEASGKKKKPPVPYARDTDMSAEQVARYERELDTERKARKATEDRVAVIERRERVMRYERGFEEKGIGDPKHEVARSIGGKKVADFSQAEFDEYLKLFDDLERYARAPVGGSMIRTVTPNPEGNGRMTEAELPQVLHFMREGLAKDEKAALKMVREAK